MAYTALLGLLQPATGSLDGTWGDNVNNKITQLIEDAVAGYSTADVTLGDWTLTEVDGGPDTARSAILIVTGTPGADRHIDAPEQSKLYVVINNSDSTVYLRGGATPTAGDFVLTGQSALFAWDSDAGDFVKVAGGSGGATGGGINQVFFNNDVTVTNDYTIPDNKNSGTFGPITINSDITVTVPSSSTWTVV